MKSLHGSKLEKKFSQDKITGELSSRGAVMALSTKNICIVTSMVEVQSSDVFLWHWKQHGYQRSHLTVGTLVCLKRQEYEKTISCSPRHWTCVMTGWEVIPTTIILSFAKSLRQLFVFCLGNLTSKSSPRLSLNLTTLCSEIFTRKQINRP